MHASRFVKESCRPKTALSSVKRYGITRYLLQSCAALQHQLAPSHEGTPHGLVDERNSHHQSIIELNVCLLGVPRATSGFVHVGCDRRFPCCVAWQRRFVYLAPISDEHNLGLQLVI